jgi:hypothetical protein
MVKTTVYLTDEIKTALVREAARTNTSEAELIRTAITRLLGLTTRPRAHFGEYSGQALTVEEMDDAFAAGFGER